MNGPSTTFSRLSLTSAWSHRWFPAARLQHLGLQGGRNHRGLLAGMPDLQETCHPLLLKSLPPAGDGRRGSIQSLLNGPIRQAVGQHEDQACSKDITSRQRARLGHLLQLGPLVRSQCDHLSREW